MDFNPAIWESWKKKNLTLSSQIESIARDMCDLRKYESRLKEFEGLLAKGELPPHFPVAQNPADWLEWLIKLSRYLEDRKPPPAAS